MLQQFKLRRKPLKIPQAQVLDRVMNVPIVQQWQGQEDCGDFTGEVYGNHFTGAGAELHLGANRALVPVGLPSQLTMDTVVDMPSAVRHQGGHGSEGAENPRFPDNNRMAGVSVVKHRQVPTTMNEKERWSQAETDHVVQGT